MVADQLPIMGRTVRSVLEARCATYNSPMQPRLFSLPAVLLALLLVSCGEPDAIEGVDASVGSLPEVRLRVRASAAEHAVLELDQSFTGVVEPFREAMVASEVSARVVTRFVEPGDSLKAGDALVALDASRLEIAHDRAKAARKRSEVELLDATRNLERGQRLLATGAISDHELDGLTLLVERARADLDMAAAAVRDAQKNLADAEVLAPFDGRIEEVSVQVGDYLVRGQHVAKIVDFSKARVAIGVTAREAASLALGRSVRIGLESIETGVILGIVRSIGRSASERGLFPVEVWVEGEHAKRLRQGMVVSVKMRMLAGGGHLLVPSSAVFRRQGMTQVFRIDAEGRARLAPVTTGVAADGRVQVVEGLSAGDQVITDGQFALAEGALVEVIR